MEKKIFDVSWSTLFKILLMVLFAIIVFLVRDILIILFLAIIVSAALAGPVDFLERRKIPRVLGTLIIFILGLGILAFVLYIIIPTSLVELKDLLVKINNLDVPVFGSFSLNQAITGLNQSISKWADALFSGSASFFGIVMTVFGNIIIVLTTLVLSFYFTVNHTGVEKFLRTILPAIYENYVIGFYLRVRKKLALWLRGQIILMAAIGTITVLGLWVLGVKYALVLGLLAGLLEIVPVAGPIFSGTIAFLVAVPESWLLGLYVILFFFILQHLEGYILVPLVMKKAIGVDPVTIVIAILIGSKLAGVVGIILAVPIAMIFQEGLGDWEKQKLKARNA